MSGVLVSEYNVSAGSSLSSPSSVGTSLIESEPGIECGETINFYIWIGEDLFSSGTSVSVNMHSISGIDYMKLVRLL